MPRKVCAKKNGMLAHPVNQSLAELGEISFQV